MIRRVEWDVDVAQVATLVTVRAADPVKHVKTDLVSRKYFLRYFVWVNVATIWHNSTNEINSLLTARHVLKVS